MSGEAAVAEAQATPAAAPTADQVTTSLADKMREIAAQPGVDVDESIASLPPKEEALGELIDMSLDPDPDAEAPEDANGEPKPDAEPAPEEPQVAVDPEDAKLAEPATFKAALDGARDHVLAPHKDRLTALETGRTTSADAYGKIAEALKAQEAYGEPVSVTQIIAMQEAHSDFLDAHARLRDFNSMLEPRIEAEKQKIVERHQGVMLHKAAANHPKLAPYMAEMHQMLTEGQLMTDPDDVLAVAIGRRERAGKKVAAPLPVIDVAGQTAARRDAVVRGASVSRGRTGGSQRVAATDKTDRLKGLPQSNQPDMDRMLKKMREGISA